MIYRQDRLLPHTDLEVYVQTGMSLVTRDAGAEEIRINGELAFEDDPHEPSLLLRIQVLHHLPKDSHVRIAVTNGIWKIKRQLCNPMRPRQTYTLLPRVTASLSKT